VADIAKAMKETPPKKKGVLEAAGDLLKEPEDSPYKRRRVEAAEGILEGAKQFSDPGPDLPTGLANKGLGALQMAGGVFGEVWSPFGAELDVGVGREIAEATRNAPESIGKGGIDYSMRMPENVAGDVVGNVGAFMIPGMEGAFSGALKDARGVLTGMRDREAAKTLTLGGREVPTAKGGGNVVTNKPEPPLPPGGEVRPYKPVESDFVDTTPKEVERAAKRAAAGAQSKKKAAEQREVKRRKRNDMIGVAQPDTVKELQDRYPSPFTHPQEGGEAAPTTPATTSPRNNSDAFGDLDTSHPSFRQIKEAAGRGAYRVSVTEQPPLSSYRPEKRWTLTMEPDVPSWWIRSSHPRMPEWFDPQYAHETEGGYVALNDPSVTEFPVTEKTPGSIWRGMSWEEYEDAQRTGRLKSTSEYNIGPAQEGLTYYSRSPRQAATYANGFAPWHKSGTPNHPPVVVKIKDPGREVKVAGTDPDEVGVPGEVPFDQIEEVYMGRPITSRVGNFDVSDTRDYATGDVTPQVGGGHSPATHVIWEKQRRGAITPQTVYHGTPHEFDRFDMGKVGTGEGAQAYGHGLYFAGLKDVAESYKTAGAQTTFHKNGGEEVFRGHVEQSVWAAMDGAAPKNDSFHDSKVIVSALSGGDNFQDMRNFVRKSDWDADKKAAWMAGMDRAEMFEAKRPQGNLYHVDIPEDHEFLDWDKPLSGQSPEVKRAWKRADMVMTVMESRGYIDDPQRLVAEINGETKRLYDALSDHHRINYSPLAPFPKAKGSHLYGLLSDFFGGPEAASEFLRNEGVAGNRYLDQGSRVGGKGTSNYVVFDDSRANIISPINEQTVYHGSPYEFDRFDSSKIGTGEGAQVFGHGLYFAGLKAVAEEYRNRLSGTRFKVVLRGKERDYSRFMSADVSRAALPGDDDSLRQSRYVIQLALDEMVRGKSADEAIATAQYQYAHYDQAAVDAGVRAFRDMNPRVQSQGKLYHVDIPEDQDFIDWDKPFSQQSGRVKKALKKAGYEPPTRLKPTLGGKEFKQLLGRLSQDEKSAMVFLEGAFRNTRGDTAAALNQFRMNSSSLGQRTEAVRLGLADKVERLGVAHFDMKDVPLDTKGAAMLEHMQAAAEGDTNTARAQAVSDHLRKAGIAGTRYLDQGSRAAGKGTSNYVLFDDSKANIIRTEEITGESQARDAAFDRLGKAQRNVPENAMIKAQMAEGRGNLPSYNAFTHAMEHVGDITHRMSEHFSSFHGQPTNVASKAETGLRILTNRTDAARIKALPEFKEFKEYADAHAALEVHNQPQEWARDAAVALGNRDFPKAIDLLTKLRDLARSDRWEEEAGRFDQPNQMKVGEGAPTQGDLNVTEHDITGKEVREIAEYVAAKNPNDSYGVIGKSVAKAVERFEGAGIKFKARIVAHGDRSIPQNSYLDNAYGVQWIERSSEIGKPPTVNILYRGANWGPGASGLNHTTLLHEMIHSVTNIALFAGRTPEMAGTDLAQTVHALDRLTNHIIRVFNDAYAKGEAPLHIGPVANSDELLTYGFTHEPFQRWLDTIPYANGNGWSAFVDTIRSLLRLPKKEHTALSALIRHGDALFHELDPDEVRAAYAKSRYDMGSFSRIAPDIGTTQTILMKPSDPRWVGSPAMTGAPAGAAPVKPPPPAPPGIPPGSGGPGGGGRGGYGGSGYGPGDIPDNPNSPVIGTESDPIVKLDNALYRAGGSATADKLEAQHFLKGLPPELTDPEVQHRLAGEIEQQLVDPDHQIPDDLKPAYEAFAKYRDEVRDTVNRLRARDDETITPFLPETGYTPRRVVGHTPMFDPREGPMDKSTEVVSRDKIIPSKRNLSKNTGALNSRTAGWMVADWKSGQMVFTREEPPEDFAHRLATMDEIEANTDIRYYRNPLINTIDEALKLRRVERNVQLLDHIKKQMKGEGMAFHYEWKAKTSGGGRQIFGPGQSKIPEGFETVPNVPQLEGWAFHPEVAEVFRDYYPGKGTDLDNALGKLNRMMIGTLFITPIPHILNVGAHAWTGRGWDWLDIPGMRTDLAAIPRAYARGFTTGLEAIHQVWTKGEKYRDLLREGTGFMYGDTQVRNFLNVMLEKAGHEIVDNPDTFKSFSDAMGLKDFGIHNAVALRNLIYGASNRSMWLVNDMFLMQRVLELQKKGMDVREAIYEAEKDIPNYRVPSRIMGNRGLSEVLRSRNFLVFGRYKYGQWKALSGMFKDLVGKDASPEERLDALGKFLVTGLTMAAIFPAMDTMLQKVTNNKDARVRRPGPFAILDAFAEYGSGHKDWATAASSMVSEAPGIQSFQEAYSNKDFFGRDEINAVTPLGYGVQAMEFAADPIYPLKVVEDIARGRGGQAVSRMFGADIPPEGTRERQLQYKARDKVKALRREAMDPIQQGIRGAWDKAFRKKYEDEPIPDEPTDAQDDTDKKLGPIP
jgi:hypothetical protein